VGFVKSEPDESANAERLFVDVQVTAHPQWRRALALWPKCGILSRIIHEEGRYAEQWKASTQGFASTALAEV
jgi:hypothetical protein